MNYVSGWRSRAAAVIASVIEEVGTEDEKALRKALREAYPFGPRKFHPYKIWLDEIKIQLGKRTYGQRAMTPQRRKQLDIVNGTRFLFAEDDDG